MTGTVVLTKVVAPAPQGTTIAYAQGILGMHAGSITELAAEKFQPIENSAERLCA